MVFLLKLIGISIAKMLKMIYGYEAINLLFRITPSRLTISVLRHFGATIGTGVRIQAPFLIHNADQIEPIFHNLTIGDNVYIGRGCIIDLMDRVDIGKDVAIGHYTIFNTHTNVGNRPLKYFLKSSKGNIHISDGVFIGINVSILESVTIGKNSVIGACSLVNNNIPDGVIAYGAPCKVVKEINHDH